MFSRFSFFSRPLGVFFSRLFHAFSRPMWPLSDFHGQIVFSRPNGCSAFGRLKCDQRHPRKADGAPKEWLLKEFSKLYRSHYPIEFRIVSYCQFRDTRENTLRFAGQFSNVCNNAIDSLGTPPFGEVVLTWKRVGQSGKAAALAQLGACVIVDDNNAVLKECRTAGALGIGVGRRDANRALYEALDELHKYLNQHRCQGTRPIRAPRGSWPPPLCKGRPRFSVTWQCRRLQLKRSKRTGFQHRL